MDLYNSNNSIDQTFISLLPFDQTFISLLPMFLYSCFSVKAIDLWYFKGGGGSGEGEAGGGRDGQSTEYYLPKQTAGR